MEHRLDIPALLLDPDQLIGRVINRLKDCRVEATASLPADDNTPAPSCVMLLLGPHFSPNGGPPQPGIILNKRSHRVRQPGDLCCPGGGMMPRLDQTIARLLDLPLFPLSRWPHWQDWRRQCPSEARHLALRLATGVRESLEEMRLNPFGVRFLGPLPPQHLVMFRRVIYPLAAWVPHQRRFFPNWEVEKVVTIPLNHFFSDKYYGRYRLSLPAYLRKGISERIEDFPCFVHRRPSGNEVLWGATYRIVTAFLSRVFDFTPPETGRLPVIERTLDESYYQ